jgi:hypothetical protein
MSDVLVNGVEGFFEYIEVFYVWCVYARMEGIVGKKEMMGKRNEIV